MAVVIYGLRCPVADTIRYVGKSSNPDRRLRAHISAARRRAYNHHTARWLRTLLEVGLKPELVVLHVMASGDRWQEIERSLISSAAARGWRLTNSTAGGEGLDFIDEAAEAAYRANLSAAMRAIWSQPARREENRKRSLKAWSDQEITNRRRASLIRAQNDPGVKARLAVTKAEIAKRPEVIAARSRGLKAAWQSAGYRDRKLAHLKGEEFAAAQSARLKQRWEDPKQRERLNGARWSPERRAEQAARAVARNALPADPEMVKRRNAAIKAAWARRKARDATT